MPTSCRRTISCATRCRTARPNTMWPTPIGARPMPRTARRATARTYWRFANFLMPFWTQTPQGEFPHQVDIRAWVPMDDTHTMFVHLSWNGRKRAIGTVKKDGSLLPGFGFGHRYQPNTTDWHGRWRLQDGEANDWGIDREAQLANTIYTGIDNIHMQDQAVTESMGAITDHAFEHLAPSDQMVARTRRRLLQAARALRDKGVAAARHRASRSLLRLARRLLLHPAAHRLAGALCRAASRCGAAGGKATGGGVGALANLQTRHDLGIVRTEGGLLSGAGDSVRVYKGIPFAAPPVGERRWRPPEPAEPWDGIREATRFGADCPQELRPGSRAGRIDEDCLTLNIWTPARAADEALPVMVWFYGGSFVFGSASDIRFDGEAFARKGVVLVTAAYRVGLFGFLAHPGLTAGIAARLLGQLRPARPDRGPRLGAAEHRGVRRRPQARHRLRRLGGLGLDRHAAHLAARGRALPARHSRKPGRVPSAGEPRGRGARRHGPGARHRPAAADAGRRGAGEDRSSRSQGARPHDTARAAADPRRLGDPRGRAGGLQGRAVRGHADDRRRQCRRGRDADRDLADAHAGRSARACGDELSAGEARRRSRSIRLRATTRCAAASPRCSPTPNSTTASGNWRGPCRPARRRPGAISSCAGAPAASMGRTMAKRSPTSSTRSAWRSPGRRCRPSMASTKASPRRCRRPGCGLPRRAIPMAVTLPHWPPYRPDDDPHLDVRRCHPRGRQLATPADGFSRRLLRTHEGGLR